MDMRMDREQAAWDKKQSCSVRSGFLNGAQPDSSAGPRSILDDHGPAEALLQVIGKHPRDSVRGAAGRIREYDLERLLLGAGRSGPQSEKSEAGQGGPA